MPVLAFSTTKTAKIRGSIDRRKTGVLPAIPTTVTSRRAR
jgi:hypothetical protein